jgi:archaellum component FlaC
VTVVIILLGLLLAASLAFNLGFFGGNSGGASRPTASAAAGEPAPPRVSRGDDDRVKKLEADLEKKRKDVEELKKAQAEVKEELKAARRKLFDHKESEKTGDDLSRARAEVERQASIQLEATRAELATALADIQRLKAGPDEARRRRAQPSTPAPAPARAEEKPVERPPEVVQRVIRELSDVEKERLARLEQQSSNDRKKANELEREVRALKGKIDRIHRESKRVYGDANLARDKFRAVEMRLNRTLLENDLLRRAVQDLEKKSGQHAEHTSLTPEELAASDRTITERHAAEDQAEAEARTRLEAAAPTTLEDAPPAEPPAPEAGETPPPARPSASA